MKIYQRDTTAAYFLWMYILLSPLAIIVFIHHYHSCDNKNALFELRSALDAVSYQQGILQKLVQEYHNEKLGEKAGIHLYGPAGTGKLRQERESVEEKISWIEGAVKRLRRAIIDQRTLKRLKETTSNDLMKDLWKEVGFAKRLKQCEDKLADCEANVNKINSTNVAMTLKLREVESECNAFKSELRDVCSCSEDHSLGPSESLMSFTVSGSFLVFITTVLVVLKRAWGGGHHLVPSLFNVLSEAKALMWSGEWKDHEALGWFNSFSALKQSKAKKEHSLFAT